MTDKTPKTLVVGFHVHDENASCEFTDRLFKLLQEYPEVDQGISVYAISTSDTFAELEAAEAQIENH